MSEETPREKLLELLDDFHTGMLGAGKALVTGSEQ